MTNLEIEPFSYNVDYAPSPQFVPPSFPNSTTTTHENVVPVHFPLIPRPTRAIPLKTTNDDSKEKVMSNSQSDSSEKEKVEIVKTSKRYCMFWNLLIIIVCLLVITKSVQQFILQYNSNESLIVMGCGYFGLALALLFTISVSMQLTRRFWQLSLKPTTSRPRHIRGISFNVIYIIVVFGMIIIDSLSCTTVVYRQASEDYWTLFNALD